MDLSQFLVYNPVLPCVGHSVLKTGLFFLCQILGHDINPETGQVHDVPHTKQSNLEICERDDERED